MKKEKEQDTGGNETKSTPESKAGQGFKNLTRSESKPEVKPQQGKPFVKQSQQSRPGQRQQPQRQPEEYQDPDRVLLGKTALVKLGDGSQVKAMVMNMGKYWVVLRVLDGDNQKTLIVNKAYIAYYEVVGQ
jgi:hypothetical protein|nr:MAG: hypothetical protein TU36_02310 [Vulcanisaeta sp. AZ3]